MRSAWILVVLCACFHPTPPEGAACANGTDCPDPLICDLGAGVGGVGAAGNMNAGPGAVANSNAGGGGGGIGAIYVRTTPGNFTQGGLTTPTPGSGPLRTQ